MSFLVYRYHQKGLAKSDTSTNPCDTHRALHELLTMRPPKVLLSLIIKQSNRLKSPLTMLRFSKGNSSDAAVRKIVIFEDHVLGGMHFLQLQSRRGRFAHNTQEQHSLS